MTSESLSPSAKQEGENDVIHSSPLPAENAIIFTDRRKMAERPGAPVSLLSKQVLRDLPKLARAKHLLCVDHPDHYSLIGVKFLKLAKQRRTTHNSPTVLLVY